MFSEIWVYTKEEVGKMKTKFILTMILASTMLLQGCGLQKLIEEAITKMRAVEVVSGT